MKEQLQENGMAEDVGEGETELLIRYLPDVGEGEETGAKYRTAKLIVVENGGEEEGAAYMAETDSRLRKGADGLRVQFFRHDLDGMQVGTLRKLGYAIQNEETVTAGEYELQMQQLHIRYGLLACGLCAVAVMGMRGTLIDKSKPS